MSGESKVSMAVAENDALNVAMGLDDRVILLGEDITDPVGGVFKITNGLSTKYGDERVRATPISEQAIVGAAVGLSLGGLLPVAELMFFDFATLALDQIVNHAAKLRYMSGGRTPTPLTVRTAVGSNRFGAQHSQSLESWFMHTPGINIVIPSNPTDAKGLLLSAVFSDDPCLFVDHVDLLYRDKEVIPAGDFRLPLGEANVVLPGDDVSIITYGPQVRVALEAAEILAERGVEAEVIDLRCLAPLDMATVLASAEKTGRAIVVHNAIRYGGPGAEVGSAISERLFGRLRAPVIRLGARFVPNPFSQNLAPFPTREEVVEAALELAKS